MVRRSYSKKKVCVQYSGTWTSSSVYCRPLKGFDQKKATKMDFPVGSAVKNPSVTQDTGVQSLGWQDTLEKEMTTYSIIFA